MFVFALYLAVASPPPPAPAVDEDGRVPLAVSGKFGEGLRAQTPDGGFVVDGRARLQLRSITALDFEPGAEEPITQDFLVRRARLQITGHVFDGVVSWYVQLGMSPFDVEEDLPIIVRDASINWEGPGDVQLRAGQMKVPFNRQRINSSSALQFPDRSRVNGELNLDRDIGVQLYHEDLLPDGALSMWLGVFGGDGRNRPRASAGLLYAARVQVAPFGGFDDDLEEGDLSRSSKLRLAVSAAAAFNDGTVRPGSTLGPELAKDDAIDYAHGTADILFKWYGFSFKSEVLLRAATRDLGDDGDARSGVGAFVQSGYMLTDHIEIAGRLGRLAPLDVTPYRGPPNDPELEAEVEVGGVVSFYFIDHNLKLQIEGSVVRFDDDGASRGQVVAQSQWYF